MGPFAILRVQKIKSWGKLRQVDAHNLRRPGHAPENANPAPGGGELLVGSGDVAADVRARLASAGIDAATVRKDAVIAVELLLTASPEFFRPGRVHEAGACDPERVAAWRAAALAFLRRQFGANLVACGLHLDEATPHLWAVLCPVDDTWRARGPRVRLNAARWFDGAAKLCKLQDAYAAAMAPLGLCRGVKGSTAKHEAIRRRYATLHGEAAAAERMAAAAARALGEAEAARRRSEDQAAQAREALAAADAERERAAALAAGIEAFADGRLIAATGDTWRPTFRLAPAMPTDEREELRRRLAPAWAAVWRFVGRVAARVEAAAARTRERYRVRERVFGH